PLSALESMDEWNRNQHGKSGLWRRVLEEGVSMADAEARTIAFLRDWVEAGQSPLCGNSTCQDRRFLHRQMPQLERYLHYRNLDVSTLKELARRWAPQVLAGVRRASAHTALSDVHDSIEELRHYRRHMAAMALQGSPATFVHRRAGRTVGPPPDAATIARACASSRWSRTRIDLV